MFSDILNTFLVISEMKLLNYCTPVSCVGKDSSGDIPTLSPALQGRSLALPCLASARKAVGIAPRLPLP